MTTLAPDRTQQFSGLVPPNSRDVGDFGGGDDDTGRLLRRYRLGLGLCVCSIVMLFVGLSSAYVVRRGVPNYDSASAAYSTAWEPLHLPLTLLLINTLVLIAASITIEAGRRAARAAAFATVPQREEKSAAIRSFAALVLLTVFLTGQAVAWQQPRARGELLARGARIAFFYVLSGTHAIHAAIGVVLLAWIALPALAPRSATRRYVATDLTAWYLHSMTVLWIYLFGFLLIG